MVSALTSRRFGPAMAFGLLLAVPAHATEAPKATETAKPAGAQLTVPPPPVLLALLRGTLSALNQANITGNYSVLRDLGSPTFRESYSAAALTDSFRTWRERRLDFAAIMLLDAKLARAPVIGADGMLRLAGHFPTAPLRVEFDLGFQPVGGNWRLATIAVDAKPVAAKPAEPPGPDVTGSVSAKAPAAAKPVKPAAPLPDFALNPMPTLPQAPAAKPPQASAAKLPVLTAPERAYAVPTPPGDRPRG